MELVNACLETLLLIVILISSIPDDACCPGPMSCLSAVFPQDTFTIKQLIKEKVQHETLLHYIKFLQRKLGLGSDSDSLSCFSCVHLGALHCL